MGMRSHSITFCHTSPPSLFFLSLPRLPFHPFDHVLEYLGCVSDKMLDIYRQEESARFCKATCLSWGFSPYHPNNVSVKPNTTFKTKNINTKQSYSIALLPSGCLYGFLKLMLTSQRRSQSGTFIMSLAFEQQTK